MFETDHRVIMFQVAQTPSCEILRKFVKREMENLLERLHTPGNSLHDVAGQAPMALNQESQAVPLIIRT